MVLTTNRIGNKFYYMKRLRPTIEIISIIKSKMRDQSLDNAKLARLMGIKGSSQSINQKMTRFMGGRPTPDELGAAMFVLGIPPSESFIEADISINNSPGSTIAGRDIHQGGDPTIQTINSLDIPDSQKAEMITAYLSK